MLSRLKEFIDSSGLSTRAFALRCGLSQSTLCNQLNGMRELSLKSIHSIAKAYPELSTDWLIRGEGEMLKGRQPLDVERLNTLVDTIATLQQALNDKDKTIAILTEQIQKLNKG